MYLYAIKMVMVLGHTTSNISLVSRVRENHIISHETSVNREDQTHISIIWQPLWIEGWFRFIFRRNFLTILIVMILEFSSVPKFFIIFFLILKSDLQWDHKRYRLYLTSLNPRVWEILKGFTSSFDKRKC